jgi:hypothetical protein
LDTQTLVEALRALRPAELNWKFALYSSHKSRDGLELDWSLCKMKGAAAWAETLAAAILEKPAAERTVAAYSPFLAEKETIGALLKTDDLIKEQIGDILLNIQNTLTYSPEDFVSGVLPKAAGYAFYGESRDEEGKITEQVLFMRRANPFLSGQKARLCTSAGDEVVVSEKPILKFTPATDFLLIGGVCYFFSAAIAKDFALEDRHFAIAQKRLSIIAGAGIISDYDRLEEAAMKPKNARKFIDFDKQILEHIARLPIAERGEFLSAYGVEIDHNGHMDTSDPEQCGLVIDLLCCRSCLDPLGRLSVSSGITPRE